MNEILPIGGEEPKPKPDPEEDLIRKMYRQQLRYDNKPVNEVLMSAAKRSNIDPALLFSSAFQEGMNLAISKPDEVSEAYLGAIDRGEVDEKSFPVDGFYNYGLDYFGDEYSKLKKYLPEGFEQRFKTYKAKNEKNQDVTTAAFATNEDALIAKAAIMRNAQDRIDFYAKEKGIEISPEDRDYFTMAYYNAGSKNAQTMLDEYAKAKDKRLFIDEGQTSRKGVHTNISPRLKRIKFLHQLLSENASVGTEN